MTETEKFETETYTVAMAMIRFGGSFVSGLGEALSHADKQNALTIKNAFPIYWETYRQLSDTHQQSRAKVTG